MEITGITADSRRVRPGYLFAALPGSKADGAKFIQDAIMHGADAILAQKGTVLPEGTHAVLLTVDNPRKELARIAATFYDHQPEMIVAVTGTSGKTSTVSFTHQLWQLAGIMQSASLGTLGVRAPGMIRSGSLTTPDTVSLHAELADLAAAGVTHLAMEASSHGLDQYRLDGVHISAAAYTNLSRDHLDYHASMDEYFAAKSRLFSDVMKARGTAVLNANDDYFDKLESLCKARGHRVISFGDKAGDICIQRRTPCPSGQHVVLSVMGKTYEATVPLVGSFQIMNALCALGLVMADNDDIDALVPLLEKLQGVPGRLQLIPGHPEGAAIYVDYAHKPGAVEAVLNTLRPHTEGKMVCVLGCGGNRDAGKRPIMGRIASGLADVVIVTDDNPRDEDPEEIRAAIMEGAPDAIEIGDRRKAIEYAVEQLHKGDVLVIAGKGHEQGQIIGGRTEPFDDADIALKSIKRLTIEV
ncbi:MAG: UDP-N-acetylmuramoyl-L-alanyl-D-glutamate--2,6-diaminopimelate ligase [Micavibrio aeruginosavorus]|uniref:UDP-N-acetylmuramoyl-L-alanyl-D-glutamate--2,6-diaminopimelate ligase n=1 Tax=Micavibrio aeruginosavorus TaxID=349221 RepID=A0A2W5N0L2_9BACT|nr:MAG: UDP-N-acetylmuramoyl-L-alanyl-D-glutamate--2,6-diaminopimelate ligase [Micavibrio aeruginosavorus]